MRYLILSDIHANLQALEAVLEAAPPADFDGVLCLGDLVGYGGDPNAVVERIRDLKPTAIVRGNHDKVSLGLQEIKSFNYVAREAAEWTLDALTPENRAYLAALPKGPHMVDDAIEIFHGSPEDEDAYIFDSLDALAALKATERPLALFGHTHVPAAYRHVKAGLESLDVQGPIVMAKRAKYLVNPGAVGQPRDADTRAGFAIVDTTTRTVSLRRVRYRIDMARAAINAASLPDSLAHRLELGR